MLSILDVLAGEHALGWLVARVKTIDTVNKKIALCLGDTSDPDALIVAKASYLMGYHPVVGDIVHAIIRENIGVLILGTTSGSNIDDVYLRLDGGTMTGDIVLAGDPTSDLHPATKQYVDGKMQVEVGSTQPTDPDVLIWIDETTSY